MFWTEHKSELFLGSKSYSERFYNNTESKIFFYRFSLA